MVSELKYNAINTLFRADVCSSNALRRHQVSFAECAEWSFLWRPGDSLRKPILPGFQEFADSFCRAEAEVGEDSHARSLAAPSTLGLTSKFMADVLPQKILNCVLFPQPEPLSLVCASS